MTDDPAWPLVLEWSREATNEHRLVEADDEAGERTLGALDGVPEWSVRGALARHAAVLAVQDWLFVLGEHVGLGTLVVSLAVLACVVTTQRARVERARP